MTGSNLQSTLCSE